MHNPIAITTSSLAGYSTDRAFEIAASVGMSGIEVSLDPTHYDTLDATYLRRLSTRHQLPIVAVGAPAAGSPTSAEQAVDLALAVGAPVVSISPPDLFDAGYKKWITDELKNLRTEKNIHIALVNAPSQMVLGILPKYAMGSVAELRSFPDVALDISNTASKSENPMEIYSALKEHLVHVYLSNSSDTRDHTLPTDGTLPLESLLSHLARDAYRGAITMRIQPAELQVGDLPQVMQNLATCKDYIEKYYKHEF